MSNLSLLKDTYFSRIPSDITRIISDIAPINNWREQPLVHLALPSGDLQIVSVDDNGNVIFVHKVKPHTAVISYDPSTNATTILCMLDSRKRTFNPTGNYIKCALKPNRVRTLYDYTSYRLYDYNGTYLKKAKQWPHEFIDGGSTYTLDWPSNEDYAIYKNNGKLYVVDGDMQRILAVDGYFDQICRCRSYVGITLSTFIGDNHALIIMIYAANGPLNRGPEASYKLYEGLSPYFMDIYGTDYGFVAEIRVAAPNPRGETKYSARYIKRIAYAPHYADRIHHVQS